MEHELPVVSGFPAVEQSEQTVQNSFRTVEQNNIEQPRTLVEQAELAVLNSSRTAEQFTNEQLRTLVEQSKEVDRTVEHKMILTVPAEDVQQWKHYVKIYYRRSIKSTSSEDTRQRNKDRYLEYRDLLKTAGIAVTEENGNLIIN